ncbi:acyl carrier protein [Amycolatopsis japonica]
MTTAIVSRTRLEEILVTNIGLEPAQLSGSASLSDLGVDSIGVIELEKVINDEFGVTMPEETPAMTLDEILDHVNSAGSETDGE